MLEKFLNLIRGEQGAEAMSASRKQAAAAALLVEAARLDRDFDAAERKAVLNIISSKFGLDDETAKSLVQLAEEEDRMAHDDLAMLDSIRNGFDAQEKSELIEMLWELSMADRNLHHFEEYLIWQMTKELGLTREDCEGARRKALDKAG
ncbi:MAG: TerB family tellurite resistance protein [Parvibaculum sp.]